MTFSNAIKEEILENKSFRTKYKKAYAYGLLLFGRYFDEESILLSTENSEIAGLFSWLVTALIGKKTKINKTEKKSAGKIIYTSSIEKQADRQKLLDFFAHDAEINLQNFTETEEEDAFLAGAFLACGRMSDPEKSYHLEFVTRSELICFGLAEILECKIPGVKTTTRRGLELAYYKECSQIEDLLTLMGASRASLKMIDVEMIKEVRNRANRVTNCETANIDKTVGAASSQIDNITLIYEKMGEEYLPDNLRRAADIRLANPELSLRELADMMEESISRSGMNHRFEKIAKIAEELRKKEQ